MKKKFIFITAILVMGLITGFFCADKCIADSGTQTVTSHIMMQIMGGPLIIGTSGDAIKLQGVGGQTVTGQFNTGAFWVDDQNGSTKYRTTISATDLIFSSGNDTRRISAENIKIKKGDGPITMAGENSGVVISPSMNDFISIKDPIKYFTYDTPNGYLGMYGDNPEILIDLVNVPKSTFKGCNNDTFLCVFRGTITYTLYEIEYIN